MPRVPPWAREKPPAPRTLRRYNLYGWPQPGPGADPGDFPPREAWPPMRVRVGTSGWAYPHWIGRFYPDDLAQARFLAFHARRFPTVEVNMTYRRLPGPHVFDAWRAATPPGFLFAVKAPRTITHDKRLVGAEDDLAGFVDLARRLGDRLGVLLFQLPPSFARDLDALDAFLALLPGDVRAAVEVRHRSWHDAEARALLARRGVAWVAHDFQRRDAPLWTTAGFAYVRLHGDTGRYRGGYDPAAILAWAEHLRA
ncbi:MAG TPA: DUF72 domain-containing protein, partial [Candidatus Thermoplasmatota archaeon]|nr:DUF72 domain-containing protein [Candidatus Thermoplasmatota archaeon]